MVASIDPLFLWRAATIVAGLAALVLLLNEIRPGDGDHEQVRFEVVHVRAGGSEEDEDPVDEDRGGGDSRRSRRGP